MNPTTSRTIAGVALIAAAAAFFIGEGLSAALWPGYSYATNYISDLGVPTHETFQGKPVYSPGAWAINTGWVINSVLVFVALMLLRDRRVAPTQTSRWLFGTAIGYSVGLILCSFFHEAPAWMQPYHLIGALLGIGGGNVALILSGIVVRQRKGPAPVSHYLIGSGIVGLVFIVLAIPLDLDFAGILERAAAYPVLLAQLIGGALLVVHSRRTSKRGATDPAAERSR